MRRLLRWSCLLVPVAVVLPGVAAWLALRGSLPLLDGDIRAPTLSAPVSVERDRLGTVTLRGDNRRDLTWTLGFVHAEERFFQMDLLRRQAAGELAELFGKVALPADRRARAHRMRARAEAELAALDAGTRAGLDAYRDGVNAGLAALSVRPPAYLLTRTTPAPWRSEDTLLVVDAMAFTLNDSENSRELAFSKMHAALPEAAYRFLTATGGNWDAPISGPRMTSPEPPDAREFDLRAALSGGHGEAVPRRRVNDHSAAGSNSFAVAGSLAGGAALIANDMHLNLRVPNIWFRARLVYPDPREPGAMIDVAGASLPGTPVIVVGSNRHIAWGFTNSYIDTVEWVRVIADPADATRYRTPDGWQPLAVHHETIHVRGAPDDVLTVRDTRWGPILASDVDATPLALAWAAQQPGAVNLELQRLEQARTAAEAIPIAQQAGIPPQNFLVADQAGHVVWTIAGRIPKRQGTADPELPADWSKPGSGWDGWLQADAVPVIADPPGSRFWTANQRVVGGAALATLGDGGYDLGARAGQIRDDLLARRHFAPADMLAIQLDDRALFLQHWKDLLTRELDRAPASALHTRMRKALGDWNGRAAIDSVAYRLVRAWRDEVSDTVLDAFAGVVRKKFPDFTLPKLPRGEYAVWALLETRPKNLLPPDYTDWDGLLIACADRVAQRLDAQPGGLAARSWGERNTTHIAYPLSRALPGFLARFLDMPPLPLPGDHDMPRVQAPAFGASERFAVAPGDEQHGYFEMPGGQSGHPLSPYYGAGHGDWAEGKPTPFLPGPAQHTLHFTPGR
ncbi:MAG: penicillin acylase family protein [Rhodanobacteraceae bacterium]